MQEVPLIASQGPVKKTTPRCIIFKLLKASAEEKKMSKGARVKLQTNEDKKDKILLCKPETMG